MVVVILWLWILFTWLIGLHRAEWCWDNDRQGAIVREKRFLPTSLSTPHYCNSSGCRVHQLGLVKSSQYGDKMILRVIKDFFIYLIYGPGLKVLIIWLLLILSCWSAPFLMPEPTWVWTAVKTNVWYSKDFISAFYFLLRHFQLYLPSHLHPW